MKQVLQNLKNGETCIENVPAPQVRAGCLLIQTKVSLVSAGTERMLVDFGKGNLIQKARSQPDKVRQVFDKIKTDGLLPTLDAVNNKLSAPLPLGYCNVGEIIAVGEGVDGFSVGDRVLSNGHHAEVVCVPKNLCALIPANVSDESAAFTVLGAIALQGMRLIKPSFGETVVVMGLGLIGLVAVQLLRASGCRVIGIDYDESKLRLAEACGASTVNLSRGEDPVVAANLFTGSRGVDAVLICASTKSNAPIHQSAMMCRKRGRIVLVGVVGMEMSRADFYEKELSFQVSCSYGPGRYDSDYEEKGHDYPLAYVRWTEKRNFEAILDSLASENLDFTEFVSHRFTLEQAPKAYNLISEGNPLGVILNYPNQEGALLLDRNVSIGIAPDAKYTSSQVADHDVGLGFIGAGSYASSVLIPAFAKTHGTLHSVCSAGGVSSVHTAKKYGFLHASSDATAMLEDKDVTAVVVSTRHSSHAKWINASLAKGKCVFVEKPMALSRDELADIIQAREVFSERYQRDPIIMVGFNRRYSPFVQKIKALLAARSAPCSMTMTVNAGEIPEDHWTQDRSVGGGRILGELCHFVDLLRFLAGSPVKNVQAFGMDSISHDSVIVNFSFENGSVAALQYLANGSKAFPKERLEIFNAGSILQLDNFKSLKAFRWPGFKKLTRLRQDKGQVNCASAFVDAVTSGDVKNLISFSELVEVANICFDIDEQVVFGGSKSAKHEVNIEGSGKAVRSKNDVPEALVEEV